MKKNVFAFSLIAITKVVIAAPNTIDMPVDMSLSSGKYCIASSCSNGWSFNQHKSGFHAPKAGVGNANDTYAWDINLNTPTFDYDNGKPVYAVEEGIIYTGNGWQGSSVGQILINHTSGSDKWSTGYVHLNNIPKKSGSVNKGDIIGYISRVGTTNNHLHFAVYNGHNAGTGSVNVSFSGKTASKKASVTNPTNTLTKINVNCPVSKLNPGQTANCAATAYYANGTNKSVTSLASWAPPSNPSVAKVSSGIVTAIGATIDSTIHITATYKEGAVMQNASTNITIAGMDGKLPADYGCTSDQEIVASKLISGGSVISLMYSKKCGTNWTIIKTSSSSTATEATITRKSDGRSYSYKGKGNIYTPMVYSPVATSCATGRIGSVTISGNAVCR